MLQGVFNEYRFNNFFDFGFGTQQQGSDLLKNTEGLYAYLISPGKSIFVYFPLAILFPVSWILFYKKDKILSLFFIVIIIITYFYIGTSNIWDSAGIKKILQKLKLIPLGICLILLLYKHSGLLKPIMLKI